MRIIRNHGKIRSEDKKEALPLEQESIELLNESREKEEEKMIKEDDTEEDMINEEETEKPKDFFDALESIDEKSKEGLV